MITFMIVNACVLVLVRGRFVGAYETTDIERARNWFYGGTPLHR